MLPSHAPPPLVPRGFRRAPAAPAAVPAVEPELRSELLALRKAEGRLEALMEAPVIAPPLRGTDLHVGPAARPGQLHGPSPGQRPSLPPAASVNLRPPVAQAGAPAGGQLRGFVFDLDLKRFFVAWMLACKEARAYWRQRRDENSRKWLGSRSKTLALWSFFGSLKQYIDQPMPAKPVKGSRVREKNSQSPGTFFSCSEVSGICKICLDGQEEVCFRHLEQLLQIRSLPHPSMAGLAFLAWTLAHAQDEDLKIDGLRTALMFNQIMGKSSGKLTMMAVMQEEEAKGVKFCFNAWKKAMKSKSLNQFRLKKQREIFRAWLEILLMDQHDRALESLEKTERQLRLKEEALQRRIDQCQRVKVKVEKMHLRRLDFFLSLVFHSWLLSCQYRKAYDQQSLEARQALALSALQLSESMMKTTVQFVLPHFQAWAARVKHQRRLQRAAENTISAMLGGSLSLVFNAWKTMKMSDFQTLQAELNRRELEFSELQEISQEFFRFSQENVERLKHMEAALQSADRALQIGAARGDSLEAELQKLRRALTQQVEDAGAQGERLKEELEEKCAQDMALMVEDTQKVTVELNASREMEARLQRLWHGMSDGDDVLQESDHLRKQLDEAQKNLEELRAGQRMQAERLRSAEARRDVATQDFQAAKRAAEEAEEAALEAEETLKFEELAAEAAQERWTAMMDLQAASSQAASPGHVPGAEPPELRRGSPPSSSLRRDRHGDRHSDGAGTPPLPGPGMSTQTSMPPLEPVPVASRFGRSPDWQRKYEDAWRPRGKNLIDTTEDSMTFDLACNILSTGAYFKKKASRRSSVSRYFFVGYGNNTTGFLKYFKDHAAAQGGKEAPGAFDLLDLVRANWDGAVHSISLTQSTKKDSSERGLTEIPETFFNALLFAVHEAEFRRQYPEYPKG